MSTCTPELRRAFDAAPVVLPGFGAVLKKARFLASGDPIAIEKAGEEIVLDLAGSPRDPLDTVLRLDFGKPPSKSISGRNKTGKNLI